MNRIGSRLVREGSINGDQLAAALARQHEEGGYLGQHLLDGGFIDRPELYDALARQWDLTPRDLVLDPPEPGFSTDAEIAETIALGWVACGRDPASGALVVATTVRPGPDLLDEVRERYPGLDVDLVVCTQRDLDHVAAAVRRRAVAGGGTPLVDGRPGVPPAPPSWPRLVLLVVLALAAFLLAPLGVVAAVAVVSSVVFALGTVLLVTRAVRRDLRGRLRSGGESDALLPAYSVLVRLTAPSSVARVLDNLAAIDYPHAKLDVLLLVAEDDDATRTAIGRAAPPDRVRVVPVAGERFARRDLAHDDGLALARGRYVVAYEEDETPAPDQLRRAVTAFETDLALLLDHAEDRPPLGILDVRHRLWRHRRALLCGLAEVDGALLLDDPEAMAARAAEDRTSVHAHLPLLRRLGGWPALGADLTASVGRASLASSSVRSREVGTGEWLALRATTYAAGPSGSRGPALLFLAYPVALLSLIGLAVRSPSGSGLAATIAALALAGGLALAVITALAITGRRHGPALAVRAGVLPVHWVMQSVAAWTALGRVLLPRRS
ncbi:hypothetical protein ABFU82_16585 [Nocardioides sp. WV_118_6]